MKKVLHFGSNSLLTCASTGKDQKFLQHCFNNFEETSCYIFESAKIYLSFQKIS